MNKKIALVHLIEESLLLSSGQKLELLDMVAGFTQKQVDALGKFLVSEQEFLLDNQEEILTHTQSMIETLTGKVLAPGENQLLVGKGKPVRA